MFCQKCGKENTDGAAFCNSCGALIVTVGASPKNKVIQAKIQTKREQIAGISQVGPVLVCLLGILFLFMGLFEGLVFIVGIILLGFTIWWSSKRENEKKKLENEIKELQAEMAA
jgi:uncharacterized membrane protein YvbJ